MRSNALALCSYAGLTFATCETILTFGTELTFIWKNPQGSRLIKVLYLLSRYFALAAHITNSILVSLVHKHAIIPTYLCRFAVLYQGGILFMMFGILDVILMLRVYASYNRSTYLAIIFICLLTCRFCVPFVMSYKSMPSQVFTHSCLVISAGGGGAIYVFAGGELFVQLFVVGLTFARHVWATRSGWGNPLFSLLSRDGSMVFFAITVGLIATIAVCLDPVDLSHAVFPGLVIIMSSAVRAHISTFFSFL
ncbi:hypothetical protein DFH08DRAFT_201436 [Mycena albidolilacea]|uniref:DUF6533 domain-containing protein n=1 Tax=Mycena albidolilacea TaxID=1033008 RepID=A0AAD7ES62_9AGAR|nr:hypothetical protein DFH08DRAFT_201436 [Mycena albidolilacea]